MPSDREIHEIKLNLASAIDERIGELAMSQTDIAKSSIFQISRSGLNDILNGRVEGHSLHKIMGLAHNLGLRCEMSVSDVRTGQRLQ